MNISLKDAQRATFFKSEDKLEPRRKPLCMVCVSDGKSGKEARATSYELHSCNAPAHVKEMRAVTRWAKRTVGIAVGDRIN